MFPGSAAIASPPRGDRRAVVGKSVTVRNSKAAVSSGGAGRFSSPYFSLARRTNMRSVRGFVKRVNTTYCACLLGQSQDVDTCAELRNVETYQTKSSSLLCFTCISVRPFTPPDSARLMSCKTRQVGGRFQRPPRAQADIGRMCVFPQGARKRSCPSTSNRNATRRSLRFAANCGRLLMTTVVMEQ